MIRNLKAIGIAIVAIFAMSAVAASAAHATEARVKCGGPGECTIKVTHHPGPGVPLGKFHTNAGDVECEEFNAMGEPFKDETKQSIVTLTELKYSECELGGIFATVSVGSGCHYTLHSGNTITGGAEGLVDLAATAGGCVIVIKAGACEVTVNGPQNNLSKIIYTNVKTGTKEEITAHAEVGSIAYTTTASCPGGAGSFGNGTYKETITAKAFNKANETEQTDLTFEDA